MAKAWAATGAVAASTPPPGSTADRSGLHEQKENATFRGHALSAVPSDLLTMRNLVSIDLSDNQLTRFPGALVAADMPRLEVLRLQHNLLYVLEDVLALSVAPRLRELNLLQNPLRLLGNRVYLLEALLGAPVCDDRLLRMVQKDDALKAHALAAADRHRPTRKPPNRHGAMSYATRLPRRTGFPMLLKLNAEWISDADVHSVEVERGRPIEYYQQHAASARHVAPQRVHSAGNSRRLGGGHDKKPNASKPSNESMASRQAKEDDPDTSERRFDGSRMTVMEMLRREARSVAIPSAAQIHRFQIDIESNGVLRDGEDEGISDGKDGSANGADDHDASSAAAAEERDVIHRLFKREDGPRFCSMTGERTTIEKASSEDVHGHVEDDARTAVIERVSTDSWNYPISTFDKLSSEDRQYIRLRSKQSVESNLQRDDHFFDSSIFLDCVAQSERSRRLAVRAVDVLCPASQPATQTAPSLLASSQSTPTLPASSIAATQLRETLATKFSQTLDERQYSKLEAFRSKAPPGVSERDMQAALSEYFLSEHTRQRQRTTQILAGESKSHRASKEQAAAAAAASFSLDGVAATVDDSLSKTKLRNAVDLANLLVSKKQEKRMMQMLIDADTRVIEQERAALEQALHRHRLDLIAANKFYEQSGHDADCEWMAQAAKKSVSPSPWQERNWRAKEAQRQALEKQQRADEQVEGVREMRGQMQRSKHKATAKHPGAAFTASAAPASTAKMPVAAVAAVAAAPSTMSAASSATATTAATTTKFRAIETVEHAARDRLALVNSHDLLVRCAEIRQHADAHMGSLEQYRDRFLDDEHAWEAMRQDPINIVRRHLRRKLHQDAQEIQIGTTQLFYSSLFQ